MPLSSQYRQLLGQYIRILKSSLSPSANAWQENCLKKNKVTQYFQLILELFCLKT